MLDLPTIDFKNIRVFKIKVILMQCMLDLVRRGYSFYIEGQSAAQKIAPLCEKFQEKYSVFCTDRQRIYKKSLGIANAHFLLFKPDDQTTFQWWLLVTKGQHPAHNQEKLLCANDKRTRLRLSGYELVELPKPKGQGGGTSLTWRMTDETYEHWRDSIRAAMRSQRREHLMQQMIESLFRVPGFSQNRIQVGKLTALIKAEWKRAGGDESKLVLPKTLGFVRRLERKHSTLADVMKDIEHEQAPQP